MPHDQITDPANAFLEAASVPRQGWLCSGTLEEAEEFSSATRKLRMPASTPRLSATPATGVLRPPLSRGADAPMCSISSDGEAFRWVWMEPTCASQPAREAIALRRVRSPRKGGKLLAEFAGNGNLEGVRCLLDLGVAASATHGEGDPYWDVTPRSTALHVAAWRARHAVVKELIARGAPVNASDGKGRTALALAVKACVDSYWKDRRSPESVAALLQAGASTAGIEIPSGYEEADRLLRR